MSRTATIDIVYASNLEGRKREWDEFIAYCAAHQPTITPVGGPSSTTGRPAATTTFGGLTGLVPSVPTVNYRPDVTAVASGASDPARVATVAAAAAASAASREAVGRLVQSLASTPTRPAGYGVAAVPPPIATTPGQAQRVEAIRQELGLAPPLPYRAAGRLARPDPQPTGLFESAPARPEVARRMLPGPVEGPSLTPPVLPQTRERQLLDVGNSGVQRVVARRVRGRLALPGPTSEDDDAPFDINDVPRQYRWMYNARNTASSRPEDYDEDDRYIGPGAVTRGTRRARTPNTQTGGGGSGGTPPGIPPSSLSPGPQTQAGGGGSGMPPQGPYSGSGVHYGSAWPTWWSTSAYGSAAGAAGTYSGGPQTQTGGAGGMPPGGSPPGTGAAPPGMPGSPGGGPQTQTGGAGSPPNAPGGGAPPRGPGPTRVNAQRAGGSAPNDERYRRARYRADRTEAEDDDHESHLRAVTDFSDYLRTRQSQYAPNTAEYQNYRTELHGLGAEQEDLQGRVDLANGPLIRRIFPTFLGAGNQPGLFTRAGIRRALSGEGLRGLGRYVSAYGVAETATQALQGVNQYRQAVSGATTSDDVLNAQSAYAGSSPLASIPVVGQLGVAVRETTGFGVTYGGRDGFGLSGGQATQADLARIRAETALGRTNATLAGGLAIDRLQNAARLGSLAGDFAGQRRAIEAGTAASITERNISTSSEVTRLSSDVESLQATNITPETRQAIRGGSNIERVVASVAGLSDNSDKISAEQTQLALLQVRAKTGNEADRQAAALQQAAVERQERSSVTGFRYQMAEMGQRFGYARGADITGIRGRYQTQEDATSDLGEKSRLNQLQEADVRLYNQNYDRDTSFLTGQTRVGSLRASAGVLASQHYDYAAGVQGRQADTLAAYEAYRGQVKDLNPFDPHDAQRIKDYGQQFADAVRGVAAAATEAAADFDRARGDLTSGTRATAMGLVGRTREAADETTNRTYADLIQLHPEMRAEYQGRQAVELQANRLTDSQRLFGVDMTTAGIRQQTIQQDYRFRGLDRTASVAGDIQGGVDQTLEARADPYLEAHPTELRDRLAAIRGSTLAGVRNLTQDAGGGVAAQQVGAFMAMRPGLANVRETRDLATAQELAGRAGTALDNAATGKGQASPSTAKIEGMLTQILKALGALDRTTQKGNGF